MSLIHFNSFQFKRKPLSCYTICYSICYTYFKNLQISTQNLTDSKKSKQMQIFENVLSANLANLGAQNLQR